MVAGVPLTTGPEPMGKVTQVALLDAAQLTVVDEVVLSWNEPVPLAQLKLPGAVGMVKPYDPLPDCITVNVMSGNVGTLTVMLPVLAPGCVF